MFQPCSENVSDEVPSIQEYLSGIEFNEELTSTVAFCGENENMVVLCSETSALEQAKACIYGDIIEQYEYAVSKEVIKEDIKISFKETLLHDDNMPRFTVRHKYYEVCAIIDFSLQREIRTYLVDIFKLKL